MVKFIQNTLIRIYALTRATGLLNTRFGRWVFTTAYWTYKRLLEPQPIALSRCVSKGNWVIDVGANLGFYSQMFSAWVSDGGRVLAVEPEPDNFRFLQGVGEDSNGLIVPLRSVLSETDGTLTLRISPSSHADHRVTSEGDGIQVPSNRLDSLMASYGNPTVGLIKIDVQGAEMRVLRGAMETLRRCQPAIYIEIDDQALSEAGTSPEEIDELLQALGYAAWSVESDTLQGPLDQIRQATLRKRLGYADFLYRPI